MTDSLEALKSKYETGGFTALSADEIATLFDIENTPENFIYVLNCLDGLSSRAKYLDQSADTADWTSRRSAIWEKFTHYHKYCGRYQKQNQKGDV